MRVPKYSLILIHLTIAGTRQSHEGEAFPKSILVRDGGRLDIHGEPRKSWTKLTATLGPDSGSEGIRYEHKVMHVKAFWFMQAVLPGGFPFSQFIVTMYCHYFIQ